MKKILMILHAYPPCGRSGAIRNVKFTKYLPNYGWEPLVITRDWNNEIYPLDEPTGVNIFRTPYYEKLQFLYNAKYSVKKKNVDRGRLSTFDKCVSIKKKIRNRIFFLIKEIMAYPDERIGWKNIALETARKVITIEKPDAIYSSFPPPTSHIIACKLKKEFGIPWLADYRDLWSQYHYNNHTYIRKILEERLEKNIISSADMLITTSSPFAEKLQSIHRKEVYVITNGFDLDDYLEPSTVSATKCFTLTYTGRLYKGKRDPSLLFSALRELVEEKIIKEDKFRVDFFVPEKELINELSWAYSVQNIVHNRGLVSYKDAVREQRQATVLLLLNWLHPDERGVYTGKIFEYLGAGRPILAIPGNQGVVEELLKKTAAGVVARTKQDVKDIIKKWYSYFDRKKDIPYHGKERVILNYTREMKAKELSNLLNKIS